MIYTLTLNPSIDYLVRLEKVNFGQLNRMQEEKFLVGGKGVNVSRILNRLGFETISLGFVGGFTGEFIKEALEKEGIKTDFNEIDKETRINIKLKTGVETEVNSKGPAINQKYADQLLDKISSLQEKDLLVISGSKARNLPDNYYQEIIRIVKEVGAEFIIDTTGEELLDALTAHPLLVKPNGEELADLYQTSLESEADFIDYGKKLIKEGAKFAIVSLGAEGALFFSENEVYRGISPKGHVKNTVGAGDSMVAAFSGKYLDQGDELEAFRFALASGSATAFSEDLASKEEIKKLLAEVKIEKIEKGWIK